MVQPQPKMARRYVFISPEVDAVEGLPGCVIAQYRRCGRATCRCATGPQHGPYFFTFWTSGWISTSSAVPLRARPLSPKALRGVSARSWRTR